MMKGVVFPIISHQSRIMGSIHTSVALVYECVVYDCIRSYLLACGCQYYDIDEQLISLNSDCCRRQPIPIVYLKGL